MANELPTVEGLIETKLNMDSIDEFISSTEGTLVDQYGRTRKTLAGIEEISRITVIQVTSPHELQPSDIGSYLVFNENINCTININDEMVVGDNFLTANVGTGAVILNMTGVEQLRGQSLVADGESFASATKIHDNYWQSSERG